MSCMFLQRVIQNKLRLTFGFGGDVVNQGATASVGVGVSMQHYRPLLDTDKKSLLESLKYEKYIIKKSFFASFFALKPLNPH